MKISIIVRALLVACLAMMSVAVKAAPDVRVVGLFSNRAVVVIDGKQRILRVGEAGSQGVRLISADSESAVLEIDGKRMTARLDGRIIKRTRGARQKEVQVWRNTQGMFTTVGSINGLPVPFLIDTGASTVAMNADQARRLGIDFRVVGTPATVTTASGVVNAWKVNLNSVKVDAIELHNVSAVVIDGAQPSTTLLGMSYLGKLDISNDGQLMMLRMKY